MLTLAVENSDGCTLLKLYQTFEETESNIGQFIEDVYNTKQLHRV